MRLLFASLCLLAAACTCTPPSMTSDAGRDAGPAVDAGDEFDAWREIRAQVRQSPDDVPARAKALVAAKDVEGLYRLVRNDIALLPTTPLGFDSAETAVRWGTRGTLRGQAGTPRERAELLKELLVEAGFSADIVSGVPKMGSTTTVLLGRRPTRDISYDAGTELLNAWSRVLVPIKPPAKGPAVEMDKDDAIRQSILAQIKPLVTGPAPAAFDPKMMLVPMVRVTLNGQLKVLNVNLDQATFDDPNTDFTVTPSLAPAGEHELKVTLSAARSAKPGTPFVLAEHTWKASEVAGRTITAAFSAPVSRAEASRTLIGDVTSFIPMLLVRGEGLDRAGTQALSVIGTPVTREGALIQKTATGITIDGNEIPKGPTAAATLTSVATLTAEATAIAFPEVEVRVVAKQSNGTHVTALAADAFSVKEGGKAVAATIRSTGASAPKVVLLFDRSDSIPDEFRLGAAAVGHDVAAAIFAAHPGAKIQIVAVDINGPTAAGPLASTIGDVDTALAALSGTGSELWTALDVVCADPSLSAVVLITDAVVDDAPTPAILSRIAAGPPVLVAPVGTANAAAAARFAELSHGVSLSGVTTTNLPGMVTSFLADRVGAYRIVYRAPAMGATPRQVTIALKSPGTATVNATYTPPATPVDPGALSALYLTVETEGHSVTRLLAGSAKATAADREQVAGALWGTYILGVEANPPSFSTLFEEHLNERLAMEAGVRALWSKDVAAQEKAAAAYIFRVPTDLRFFASALPGEQEPGDVTFADGLTVVLHRTRPVLGVKVVREIDMLPLVPHRTVAFDGSATYVKTLERTARLNVTETARFGDSTRAQLAGKTLAKFDPLTVETTLGPAWAGVAYPAYSDYDVLAPASGTPVAFWAVHKQTGEVIGVMPNGGGLGADESVQGLVDRLQAILDAVKRVCEGLGYEGVSVWADLESIKVSALGNAIATFEGEPHVDPAPQIATDTCNAAVNSIGGPIPGIGPALGLIGDLQSLYRVVHIGGGIDVPHIPGPCG